MNWNCLAVPKCRVVIDTIARDIDQFHCVSGFAKSVAINETFDSQMSIIGCASRNYAKKLLE